MKRKLLILIVMMLPLIAMSQGVITRPGKNPAKTVAGKKQSKPASSTNAGRISKVISIPITVNGVTFKMIKVDGGTFTMGATAEILRPYQQEKPTHKVALSTYYIGETEVTQALWQAVMGNNPSKFKGDDLPVENVSWNDCQKFILKLNELTNRRFRLPTEAEWEFAARGGNRSRHTQYSGSKNMNDVAWHGYNSGGITHPVKSKKANELGLYDMSGNVWELCQDWFGEYSRTFQKNPTGPDSGTERVIRGGGWRQTFGGCNSYSYRVSSKPDVGRDDEGFRLALSE